jgi:hypothetical protein
MQELLALLYSAENFRQSHKPCYVIFRRICLEFDLVVKCDRCLRTKL